MHLIIDGYGGDTQKLQDEGFIYELLDRYPSQMGLTKIAPPYVIRYIGVKPEDWGISGFVLIAESHISIHTFVERSFVNIDVFSCKEFNADQVIRDFQEDLQLTKLKSCLVGRGLAYYHRVEVGDFLASRRAEP